MPFVLTVTTFGPTPKPAPGTVLSVVTISNPGPGAIPGPGVTLSATIDPTPAGITRTYTSSASGGATGNTAVGTGPVFDAALILPVGSMVVYTIVDSVPAAGAYTLQALANDNVAQLDIVTGQAITFTGANAALRLSCLLPCTPEPAMGRPALAPVCPCP